jgi:2',3'-cyclic-nucleotide 2'-phosphodiesterase/3'-nucleotidase
MFSGMTYEIDLREPSGSRIKNVLIDGKPLDKDATYKLALNNYRFGTLKSLGLIDDEDRYYDAYEEFQDGGRIRDLIIKYTQEVKNGVLEPSVDNNWKIVGIDLDSPYKEEVFELIRTGKISISSSEDGRSLKVKPLNIYELIDEGIIDAKDTSEIKEDTFLKTV